MEKEQIFAKGSKTYYTASKFFPKQLRENVTTLYAFVRCVDDFVDSQPQDIDSFEKWDRLWQQAWQGTPAKVDIIDDFVHLAKEFDFKEQWIAAFMASMRFDVEGKVCHSLEESIWYMYGSAEVIGLMMAKIMDIPEDALEHAAMLGRSMQYINYIRDIAEDNKLGRKYLMGNLTPQTPEEQEEFCRQVHKELLRYETWRKTGRQGFKYIPYAPRVAIMTADDMYSWTGRQIKKNPLKVFEKKIKPSKLRIMSTGLKNMVKALWI